MTSNSINSLLENLANSEEKIKELAKLMITEHSSIFPVDYLAIAVMNRSLSLISGFITLIKTDNFIGAAHLVRPHLDNFLRFYSVWQVKEPHEFAMKILNGERIDKLKDQKGKYMKDFYLVELASNEFSWIEKVYKETSGFIHLSNKHFFTSSRLKDKENGILEFKVSKFDKYVNDNHRVEGILGMIEITNCICELIYGWIYTKNNPPNS